jgi:hypothetical protein
MDSEPIADRSVFVLAGKIAIADNDTDLFRFGDRIDRDRKWNLGSLEAVIDLIHWRSFLLLFISHNKPPRIVRQLPGDAIGVIKFGQI